MTTRLGSSSGEVALRALRRIAPSLSRGFAKTVKGGKASQSAGGMKGVQPDLQPWLPLILKPQKQVSTNAIPTSRTMIANARSPRDSRPSPRSRKRSCRTRRGGRRSTRDRSPTRTWRGGGTWRLSSGSGTRLSRRCQRFYSTLRTSRTWNPSH